MLESQTSATATISAPPTKLVLDTGPFLQIHGSSAKPTVRTSDLQEATDAHNTADNFRSFQISFHP